MGQVKVFQGVSQRLILTPQLKQRIDMLAMTKLELLEVINRELQENPVLEEVEEKIPVAADELRSTEKDFELALPSASCTEKGEGEEVEPKPKDPFEETDFDNFFEEYLDPAPRTERAELGDDTFSLLEKLTPGRLSLYDELMSQLSLARPQREEVREAAEAIIGSINSDGYLEASLEELMALGGWSEEVVQQALEIVQSFDPPGIGARTLKECLLLQLQAKGWGDRLAAQLVSHHLEDLQRQRLVELAKALEIPLEQLLEEVELIRQLDPKPGRSLGGANPQYIVPEVSIVKIGDEYSVILNEDGVPQLRISPYYRRLLRSDSASKEARDFVREKFRMAVELLRNVEHRKRAIYRVCKAIARRQKDFLDHGIEHLKPMLLKDIAAELGLSLSTISRVVNNKYIDTPQGIIELRRFFTEGMTKENGEEVSTRVVKLKIKKHVEEEEVDAPLTDDDIVKILSREGVKISRRTVTKYRKQLGIPSSRDRHALLIGGRV